MTTFQPQQRVKIKADAFKKCAPHLFVYRQTTGILLRQTTDLTDDFARPCWWWQQDNSDRKIIVLENEIEVVTP